MKKCANTKCCNEIKYRYSTAKYCSESCRLAAAYQKKLERLGKKLCECCGKEYQVTQKASKFCQSCAAKKREPARNSRFRDRDTEEPDVIMRNKFLLRPVF